MIKSTVKKFFALLLASAFAFCTLSCLSSCTEKSDNGEIHIVVTIFPVYDWVSQILGINPSDVKLSMLIDNGKDVHSYQATVDDIATIASCDMIIYVGGESDAWVEDAIKNSRNDDIIAIKLLDFVEPCADSDACLDGHHDCSAEDEHVWLSVKYAESICEYIAQKIIELDEDGRAVYSAAAQAYCDELIALDAKYEDAVRKSNKRTLIFADRFPFAYLLADYGIEYYAAFDGCSSETEASFETVAFLAGRIDELGVSYVLVIDGSDSKLANTIISNTLDKDQSVLALESMQSVSTVEAESGITYVSVMQNNLELLRKALA